jgi:hypothetical protein
MRCSIGSEEYQAREHRFPRTAIRFDALLDGTCANRYMFWFGEEALHSGAPSNPIDLTPNEP